MDERNRKIPQEYNKNIHQRILVVNLKKMATSGKYD
jgi:hypothetical protein